jgi:hypothetical protein
VNVLGPQRSPWLDAAIAFALCLVGEAAIAIAFSAAPGALLPVPGLLLPGLVGGVAALVTRRGTAVVAVVVGTILGYQVAILLRPETVPADLVAVALVAGAAALGFTALFGARAGGEMSPPFKPPSPLDRERIATELTAQLRSIDPAAPGSFERAVAVLRQVNEQLQMYGPYSPWSVGPTDETARRAPSELLQIQAELIEAARVSAMAAGARRVTITSSNAGVDVQAIFGDPIVGEVDPRSPGEFRPIDG